MNTVLFITNIPSPYRVKFFEELGKHCNLTVVFERRVSSERDESWKNETFTNFNAVFCDGRNVGADHAFSLKPIRAIKEIKPDILILTNNMSLGGIIEVAYCKIKRIPFSIEGDGAFVPDRESFIKRMIKTFSIKGADKYYSTCANHDKYYLNYGAKKDNLVRYPFSSISKNYIKDYSFEEKKEYRNELGIKEKNVIVTVGQFIYRKGFDVLSKAMSLVDGDVGVYILGGNELPFEVHDERIHAVGFKLPKERDKYFASADLFVLPTREDIWGLVINEAMACGLPVVTTDKCNAGLEMVEEGRSGYIVPSEDIKELAERINGFFALSEQEKAEMTRHSFETAGRWTIENMVTSHVENFRI